MVSDRKREEPKFEILDENDVYYLVRNINGENVKILSSSYSLEYRNGGELRIEDEKNDKTVRFKFDENTLQLYISHKYLKNLGEEILKN